MFHGSINSASVHPRVIVKRALFLNAAAVVVAHNHPSGDIEPSSQDRNVTRMVKEALTLIEVRLLDHIIIGSTDTFSFSEQGDL